MSETYEIIENPPKKVLAKMAWAFAWRWMLFFSICIAYTSFMYPNVMGFNRLSYVLFNIWVFFATQAICSYMQLRNVSGHCLLMERIDKRDTSRDRQWFYSFFSVAVLLRMHALIVVFVLFAAFLKTKTFGFLPYLETLDSLVNGKWGSYREACIVYVAICASAYLSIKSTLYRVYMNNRLAVFRVKRKS